MNPITDTDRQRRWRHLGHVFTVTSMLMTGWAGWHLGGDSLIASVVLAVLFAAVTYGAAHLLTEIDASWAEGRRNAAIGLTVVFGLFFCAEYFAHTMFNVGHRATDIEHAQLQDTRFDDTQSQKAELAEKKKLLEGRLDKLEAQHAWMSTKPSAAWKAEIANMEGDKVFARSKQCANVTKADSRAFCDKLAELRANLAVAEDHDKTSEMLAATETALLNTREKSASMTKGESSAAEQTKVIAQLTSFSLTPSATQLAWVNIGIGGFVSLLSSMAAAVANWLAGGIRSASLFVAKAKCAVEANPLQPQIDELKAMLLQMAQGSQRLVTAAPAPIAAPAAPINVTENYTVTDDQQAKRIREGLLAAADRIERKAA
jgi:hypothetical protein